MISGSWQLLDFAFTSWAKLLPRCTDGLTERRLEGSIQSCRTRGQGSAQLLHSQKIYHHNNSKEKEKAIVLSAPLHFKLWKEKVSYKSYRPIQEMCLKVEIQNFDKGHRKTASVCGNHGWKWWNHDAHDMSHQGCTARSSSMEIIELHAALLVQALLVQAPPGLLHTLPLPSLCSAPPELWIRPKSL